MSDHGQKPGIAEPFSFTIRGEHQTGMIIYHHGRDRWVLRGRYGQEINSIDANAYGTIREFKVWGKVLLNRAGVPE